MGTLFTDGRGLSDSTAWVALAFCYAEEVLQRYSTMVCAFSVNRQRGFTQ